LSDAKKSASQIFDETLRTTYREEADDSVVIQSYQDAEPIMDFCANARRADREERGAFGKRQEFRMTMSVPMNVIQQICVEHKLDFFNPEHSKRIARILKGPDYAAFRTTIDKRI
jgi:hypothetical protein